MADVLDIDNAEEFDVDEGDGKYTYNKKLEFPFKENIT